MRDKIFKHYLDNDHEPKNKLEPNISKEISSKSIDSRIITLQHAELISKWIDRLEINDNMKNSN